MFEHKLILVYEVKINTLLIICIIIKIIISILIYKINVLDYKIYQIVVVYYNPIILHIFIIL